jgi:hypothetical protein
MHKRLPNIILPCFLVALSAFFFSGDKSPVTGTTLTQAEQEYSFVTLDSMEAQYHPANKVVIVKGSIKNTSKIVLRGYISLHILSSTGTTLHTTEMAVKRHQPIMSGETVSFDTVLNVSKIAGAAQISADFTWD